MIGFRRRGQAPPKASPAWLEAAVGAEQTGLTMRRRAEAARENSPENATYGSRIRKNCWGLAEASAIADHGFEAVELVASVCQMSKAEEDCRTA